MVRSDSKLERNVSKSEDYPSGLTTNEKEIFIVFDVIYNRGGTPRKAREEISRRLQIRPPHRTTITPVFKVGLELFREDPSVLTNEEIIEIIKKVGYSITSSKVVDLHRLYQLWKIHRLGQESLPVRSIPIYRKETEELDLDAIVLTPRLERRHKVWVLRNWLSLDEGKIADRLNVSLEDVRHDIEETRKELASKTEEEAKMEHLPPWVNQAQQDHLDGIRQLLERFRDCFLDINPRNRSFWHPLDEDAMTQLRGHLRDKAFWSHVKDFSEKSKECESLLDSAYEKFTSAGEKLAPLESPTGPLCRKASPPAPERSASISQNDVPTGLPPNAYITSGWARQVAVLALSPELGLERQQYHHGKLKDGDCLLISYNEYLYIGPDGKAAEQKHNELVNGFIKTKEFSRIVNLMKELRDDLRQQIVARIDQCLRKREYSFNYCSDCPADQARKMLKGNN